MKLPKYTFYLGKQLTTTNWQEDKWIDAGTGEVFNSTLCAIGYLTGYSEEYGLYIALSKPGAYSLFYYDINGSYIGHYENTVGASEKFIIPPSNTYEIRIGVLVTQSEFRAIVAGEYNFIYSVHEAYPAFSKLTKKYEIESSQQFFKVSLEGDIAFFSSDFDYITENPVETEFIFVVYKGTRQTSESKLYYTGVFYKTDCEINYDLHKIIPSIHTLDGYTTILSKWEETYNLLKLAPAISQVDLKLRPIVQCYIRGGNTISSYFAGTYTESDVLTAVDSQRDLIFTYGFNITHNFNEITVQGSDIQAVNGAYAGGDTSPKWTNGDGYYIEATPGSGTTSTNAYWILKLYSPEGELLYELTGTAGLPYAAIRKEPTYDGNTQTNFEVGYYFKADFYDIGLTKVNGTGRVTLTDFIEYHIYERVLTNQETIDGEETSLIGPSDMVVNNINYKRRAPVSGTQVFHTAHYSEEPTSFGLIDTGRYFTNKFLSLTSGRWRPLPLCKSTWGATSIWFAFNNSAWPIFDEKASYSYTCKDAYNIGSIISVLLSKVAPNVTHAISSEYSNFLYGDSAPLAGIARFYMILAPKSNILKSNYDQAAQKAEVSLKKILDFLATYLQCYWWIDDYNRLRIEHISYFYNGEAYSPNRNVQIDLTSLTDKFNRKSGDYCQNTITYDKDSIITRYEFSWSEKATELFDLVNMDVQVPYAELDNKKEIAISDFAADVDLMLAQPDNFSEDGFAVLLCEKSIWSPGRYTVPIVHFDEYYGEDGMLIDSYVQNGYASWLYLYKLYLYNQAARFIKIDRLGDNNSGIQTFLIQKVRESEVMFFSDEDPDTMALIQTSLGTGTIKELSINIDTRAVSAKLIYELDT